eukprot:TRINITY_DN2428_c0_g1_i2.p1 TRINITY_DN2428_c0_g1~~TRINITY_DN2428_c0_g1_i2.p1  ORF type:complete len:104 (+),score=27.88 TRINITY_DN2428_c0_g1_i2:50-361(+)
MFSRLTASTLQLNTKQSIIRKNTTHKNVQKRYVLELVEGGELANMGREFGEEEEDSVTVSYEDISTDYTAEELQTINRMHRKNGGGLARHIIKDYHANGKFYF